MTVVKGSTAFSVTFTESEIRSFNKYFANSSDFFAFLTSDENFLIRKDPVEMCGYHPCKVAKCLTTPTNMCVSDSECKPVFFNTNGKIIESCKGKSLKLSVNTLVMIYFDRLVVKVLFFEP